MSKALFPGSFDPFTNGHLDILRRAAAIFDAVVVGVGHNQKKPGWLPVGERVAAIEQTIAADPTLANASAASFTGLTTGFAAEIGADLLIKGARSLADWEWEYAQANTNWNLAGIDTLLLPTRPEWATVSSSIVRELSSLGAPIHDLVPPPVIDRIARSCPQGPLTSYTGR